MKQVEGKYISDLREVKVSDHQEECRADYKDVVVVLVDIGKSTGSSFGDYFRMKRLAIAYIDYLSQE